MEPLLSGAHSAPGLQVRTPWEGLFEPLGLEEDTAPVRFVGRRFGRAAAWSGPLPRSGKNDDRPGGGSRIKLLGVNGLQAGVAVLRLSGN
jgi:hypothetical protein